jgi:hypothetical protein
MGKNLVVTPCNRRSQTVWRPPAVGCMGGVRVVCMRDIFIFNEYEHKIKYIFVGTLLG